MKLKPQQYWAIIITLFFHVLVFWFLFFTEIRKNAEDTAYEIELAVETLETENEEKKAKIEELANAQLQELLSNKAAKRAVAGEYLQEQTTSEELQAEFEEKQAESRSLKQHTRKSKINFKEEKKQEEEEKAPQTVFYVGKSRVEYFLAQRYRVKLPIPVYKCEGGGTVEVAIFVNSKGTVVNAELIKERSRSGSDCMKEAALNAALTSVFSENLDAPAVQQGRIVYQFAPQ